MLRLHTKARESSKHAIGTCGIFESIRWMRIERSEAEVDSRDRPLTPTFGSTLSNQIRNVQSLLSVGVDGKPGPQTWNAISQRLGVVDDSPPETTNPRSERIIATLLPEVRPYARALYFKAREHGIVLSLISGTRSFAEQDAIYSIGRDAEGNVVDKRKVRTKAKAGFSNHNFGIAFDVGLFEGSRYIEESPNYAVVGALGEELGLEWGGRWRSFPDPSHFQLRPAWAIGLSERAMLARLRVEYPRGISSTV